MIQVHKGKDFSVHRIESAKELAEVSQDTQWCVRDTRDTYCARYFRFCDMYIVRHRNGKRALVAIPYNNEDWRPEARFENEDDIAFYAGQSGFKVSDTKKIIDITLGESIRIHADDLDRMKKSMYREIQNALISFCNYVDEFGYVPKGRIDHFGCAMSNRALRKGLLNLEFEFSDYRSKMLEREMGVKFSGDKVNVSNIQGEIMDAIAFNSFGSPTKRAMSMIAKSPSMAVSYAASTRDVFEAGESAIASRSKHMEKYCQLLNSWGKMKPVIKDRLRALKRGTELAVAT